MASQLDSSSPLMMEPWADSFSSYGDPCLGSDGTSHAPLMFPDLWPLEAGNAYAAPPLYPVSDHLSPPLGDEDMLDVPAAVPPPPPPPPACLDPFAWQGGDVMATAPAQPLWPGDDAAGGFDMAAAPPPPPPGVGSFHVDSPAWQAAPRGGGYRAPQRTTPPAHQHQYSHHPRPPPPASRPLAAAAPAVKRSHSGTPLAAAPRRRSAGTARRASSSSPAVAAPDRPPAGVASGDALPGALRGLAAMERGLRSANHEQQRLLSATYERWDRRHSSASA